MHCCAVVRGAYPPQLAAAWRAFDDGPNNCENDNPMELLPDDQLYLVMVSSDGGRDLEKSDVPSFAAAKSMLCQVRCLPTAALTLPCMLCQVRLPTWYACHALHALCLACLTCAHRLSP